MKTMRIYNQYGGWEFMKWSYNPDENPEAKEKAYKKLTELGIDNATVYEVAPIVFWYSLPDNPMNVSEY